MPTPAGITRRNVSFGMLFGNESDGDLSADVTVTASEPLLVWDETGDCAISNPYTVNMPAADDVVIPLIPTDLMGWKKSGIPVSNANPTHTYTVTIQPRKGVARAGAPIVYRGLVVPSGSGTMDADGSAVWTGASGTVTGPLDELAAAAVAAAVGELGAIPLTQKGAASGVATLDGGGKIPDVQIPDGVARDSEVAATYGTVVAHGSTAGTARPAGAAQVLWKGTVTPTNAADGDRYLNTSTGDEQVKVSGSFVALNKANNDAVYLAGRACSTDGTHSLAAPTGVGLEFVITTTGGVVGLADIRHNGTSL